MPQLTLILIIATLLFTYHNIDKKPVTTLLIITIAVFFTIGWTVPAIATLILLVAIRINVIMFRAIMIVFKTGLNQVTR